MTGNEFLAQNYRRCGVSPTETSYVSIHTYKTRDMATTAFEQYGYPDNCSYVNVCQVGTGKFIVYLEVSK